MEKKKRILFIAIVVVLLFVVLGTCYIVSKKGKNNEVISDEKVENKISEEENIVEEIENTIETEEIEDEEVLEIGVTNKEKIELEEKAKEIVNEYLPLSAYEADTLGAMPYILVKLDLIESEELDALLRTVDVTSDEYVKTTVKYDDFKNVMSEYLAEEYFNKYFKLYKNMDGYVGVQNSAAGASVSEVEAAELVSIDDEGYHFELTLKDVQTYEIYLSGDDYVKENDWLFYNDVTFKFENDKFVICKFSDYTPYIEGDYVYEASDVGYKFFADGKVEYSTSTIVDKGTYKAIEPNTFKIVFTERVSYEEDYDNKYIDENGNEIIPFKEVESEIEITEKVVIINENKLTVEYDVDGEMHKGELVKYEEE